jgi:NADPH:quinone reductase-like Zn-dependent oxidoreductase
MFTPFKGEIKKLGAYARYTLADEDVAFKIPSGLTPASASTIPLAATTSLLALFSKDCLNMNHEQKNSVLIWGGACE